MDSSKSTAVEMDESTETPRALDCDLNTASLALGRLRVELSTGETVYLVVTPHVLELDLPLASAQLKRALGIEWPQGEPTATSIVVRTPRLGHPLMLCASQLESDPQIDAIAADCGIVAGCEAITLTPMRTRRERNNGSV